MGETEWMYAFASAVGPGHLSEELPCQDYCQVEQYGNFSIAVVCDGAGSCSHSDVGARAVTEFCIHHFHKKIIEQGWDQKGLPAQEKWHASAKGVLAAIRNDLENLSINQGLELKSLSCTVIVVLQLEQGILVTHIGDGRAGYCDHLDEWHSMLTPVKGAEANQTVFITSDIWDEALIDQYIESRVITDEVKAFCLLTDGCEKAAFECNLYDEVKEIYYDPNKPYKQFFHKNITVHLPALHATGASQEEINQLWKQFLEAGNERLRIESDDKTMVLAVKVPTIKLVEDDQASAS